MAEAATNGDAGEHMLPASADTLIRFQIGAAGKPERADAAVFLLCTPTGRLVAAASNAVNRLGLNPVTSEEYRAAIILTLEESRTAPEPLRITEEEYQRNVAVFTTYVDRKPWPKADGPEPWDRRLLDAKFTQLENWVAGRSPFYRDLRVQEVENRIKRNAVICSFALRGWERREGTCEVVGDRATEATIALLSEGEQGAIATHWLAAQFLSAAQKKTSDLLSQSLASPNGSRSGSGNPPTARRGKSAGKSTQKTHDT